MEIITDDELSKVIGCELNDTSDYDDEDIRKVAAFAYFQGQREATRLWAWWKDGTQYVGSTGHTLGQALDTIASEEYQTIGDKG